jgi:hypothetical protein|tara:strand:- start:860 stop:1282 length:423 start_codon:yes stop_codon:yes gene_type:complete
MSYGVNGFFGIQIMNPFDFVNQILYKKENIIADEATEKAYVPFIVNRSLSYHKDCIGYANEMNRCHFADHKMQNDFLLNTIRSRKRPFAKWVKAEKSDDIECIKAVYGFSDTKAREALRLLSDEQIQQLKEQTDIGGLGK